MAGESIFGGLTNHTASGSLAANTNYTTIGIYINCNHPYMYMDSENTLLEDSAAMYLYYRTSDTGSWILNNSGTCPDGGTLTVDSTGLHAVRWLAQWQSQAGDGKFQCDSAYVVGNSASRRGAKDCRPYILADWRIIGTTDFAQTSYFTSVTGTPIVNASHVVLTAG